MVRRARSAARTDRRRPARRRAAGAAIRRRRRFSSSTSFRTRPTGRSTSSPRRSTRSAPIGLYRFQPDPATEQLPAGAHLAGERAHDQLDARRAAALRRQAADASRRCAARGLADGDLVRIFNDLGEVHCPLTVAADDPPRHRQPAQGIWRRSTRNNTTGTALVPDALTDLGGGARASTMRGCR